MKTKSDIQLMKCAFDLWLSDLYNRLLLITSSFDDSELTSYSKMSLSNDHGGSTLEFDIIIPSDNSIEIYFNPLVDSEHRSSRERLDDTKHAIRIFNLTMIYNNRKIMNIDLGDPSCVAKVVDAISEIIANIDRIIALRRSILLNLDNLYLRSIELNRKIDQPIF